MATLATGLARWQNRVALVTGASAGIGAALCQNLAKQGLTVIGCARNVAPMEAQVRQSADAGHPGKIVPVKCDVTKESEVAEMFKFIEANHKGVDVCVNNAGMAVAAPLLELTADQMRSMLDVNIVGLVLCSKFAANSMMARGVNDGHIILINSISGHRVPASAHWSNFYAASKFAVTAITEGFRRELVAKSTRIRCTAISPGLVETEFAPRAFGQAEGKSMYEARAQSILKTQDVVDAVLYALAVPEHAQVHDVIIRPTGDPMVN